MKLLLLLSFYVLLGCQLQPQLSQPALLSEPSADSAKQIKLIIEQALNSKNILISQPLGDPKEKMLANALHYIKNEECLSNSLQANGEENSNISKIRGKVLRNHPAVMTRTKP